MRKAEPGSSRYLRSNLHPVTTQCSFGRDPGRVTGRLCQSGDVDAASLHKQIA